MPSKVGGPNRVTPDAKTPDAIDAPDLVLPPAAVVAADLPAADLPPAVNVLPPPAPAPAPALPDPADLADDPVSDDDLLYDNYKLSLDGRQESAVMRFAKCENFGILLIHKVGTGKTITSLLIALNRLRKQKKQKKQN